MLNLDPSFFSKNLGPSNFFLFTASYLSRALFQLDSLMVAGCQYEPSYFCHNALYSGAMPFKKYSDIIVPMVIQL